MLAEKLDLFATLQGTTFRRKVEEQSRARKVSCEEQFHLALLALQDDVLYRPCRHGLHAVECNVKK
jgi:hypothetical protein